VDFDRPGRRIRGHVDRLTFEADAERPGVHAPTSGNRRRHHGKEIQSSYAVEYVVETSTDHASWTSVYRTTAGTGEW